MRTSSRQRQQKNKIGVAHVGSSRQPNKVRHQLVSKGSRLSQFGKQSFHDVPKAKNYVVSNRLARLAKPRKRKEKPSFFRNIKIQDVQLYILSFLGLRDLSKSILTSKEWFNISTMDLLWHPIWLKLENSKAKRLGNPPMIKSSNQWNDNKYFRILSQKIKNRQEARHTHALKQFRQLQSNGVEFCMDRMFSWLKIEFEIKVNGLSLETMAVRRKSQQSKKPDFCVNAPIPAPNICNGTIKYSSVSSIKAVLSNQLRWKEIDRIQVLIQSNRLNRSKKYELFNWELSNCKTSISITGDNKLLQLYPVGSYKSSDCIVATIPETQGRMVDVLLFHIHHADVLNCLKLFDSLRCPFVDDSTSFHSYSGNITIRSLGQTWFDQTFRGVFDDQKYQPNQLIDSKRIFILNPSNCTRDISREIFIKGSNGLLHEPALYLRTPSFVDHFGKHCVVDFTLFDEHGGTPWYFSRVLESFKLDQVDNVVDGGMDSSDGNYAFSSDRANGFLLVYKCKDIGQLVIECATMVQDPSGCGTLQVQEPMLVVRTLFFDLKNGFLRDWFGGKLQDRMN